MMPQKKKESGAEGQKRQKLEEEEAKKSSKFFMPFFAKPGPSSQTPCSVELPAPATMLLESEGGSSTNPPQPEEEVKLDESEYDEIRSEAAAESVDMTGGEGGGDVEFIDGIEPDYTKPSELDGAKEPRAVMPEVIEQRDIGLLKFENTGKAILPDALRTEIIKLGSKYFQNSEGPFLPTNNCSMNKTWFRKKLGGGCGEEVGRPWLVYSPSKKSAFCFCCLLYSRSVDQSSLEQESGFNHWEAPERISVHENAKNHRECFLQWKEMERNVAGNRGLIEVELRSQIEKEKQRWRDILTRILSCIKYLATENLALQGYGESLQLDKDDSSVEDFLGLVKVMATYDPVLKEHLTYVESHPGSPSYLSLAVQNEFIHLMASTVRQSLLRRIRKAKYYGLMFDWTPDQAHCEQVSEVVRYVEVDFERKTVHVRESFLGFIQVSQKDAESLVEEILKQLEKDKMELQDCRSQCYDNAAVMARHRSGVCQRISEKNNLAVSVNCDNHSLNLVGVHTAKQDLTMAMFFGTIEAIYMFFSRSTQYWEKLKNAVPVVVKLESETRWSSRTEAVKPVNNHLEEILQVLQDMIDDEDEYVETRSDAMQLHDCMLTYDFLTLLGFWNKVLIQIDSVQKRLRNPSMNFHDAALDLKALRDHFDDEREVLVSESLEVGLGLCQEWDVDFERRPRLKKRMPGEKSRDAGLTAREEMESVMKGTLGHLHREMDERFTHLHDTDARFGFLLDIEGLCYSADRNDLKKNCENFCKLYSSDVDEELYEEILDWRMLLSRRTNMKISKPEELLEFIVQYGDESVFPNLRIAIQIMLTIAVSIPGCERSFSKLELILSYLRDSMGQGRVCDLALLSVEREEMEKTDFDPIIDQFASVKARMMQL
ncbi:uncharacterized protein LOC128343036 [Hemicordylus capensis]|uniref:uncharacterized protein LOC128343036 n=1 Tax=Hemicordylus capensis TaxID=884348 RepID=UPI0023029B99|nr:uncharacterized protein LOC128343036 [Hemicordylus capensis]XP_053147368.1 uncharacterized protein LOC128343036 [Hemicordylus capensis]XP_053147369.1 uncharacterized protein LOC128343036 [Hemicordylus capensis]